ncbi:MAG: DUF3800 domain-containing protein [Cytophagales bacterium]
MARRLVISDESNTGSRIMVLGGFCINVEDQKKLRVAIQELRDLTGMYRELKGTKISKKYLEEYKEFSNLFFDLEDLHIKYWTFLVDTSCFNHRINGGNTELTFYKMYYQFLLWCFGSKYGKNEKDTIQVVMDNRANNYSLSDLKDILNNGFYKHIGPNPPFISIDGRHSDEDDLIQLNDILLWAVGAQVNEHDLRENANKSKAAFANHVSKKMGFERFKSIKQKSIFYESWKFQPKKKNAPTTPSSKLPS